MIPFLNFSSFSINWPTCSSVAKSHLTHCDPKDCSMPGSSILNYFPDLAQIHVHWVSDAI